MGRQIGSILWANAALLLELSRGSARLGWGKGEGERCGTGWDSEMEEIPKLALFFSQNQ